MVTVAPTRKVCVLPVALLLSLLILSPLPPANAQAAQLCKVCAKWVFQNVVVPICVDYIWEKCTEKSPPPTKPPPGPPSPGGSASGDPHFVGAHGTRYDFNGLPGKDYCFYTDSYVHINMHMIGYVNDPNMKGWKAVNTWIGKLGIMWKVGGKSHSLVLSAREGPQVERGSGFLESAEYNYVALPAMQDGETRKLAGGATLSFKVSFAGKPARPLDVYTVTFPGLLTVRVALRTEGPGMRTPTNAMTHIDVTLLRVHASDKVHGVIGQTFRQDRESRAMKFKALSALLRRPVAADGPSGTGFLDGSLADYETSSVFAADCRFSAFNATAAIGAK